MPWPKGKHRSGENKRKIREARTGTHLSEKTKKKLSNANKGQVPWKKGKNHSEKTKNKIGNSNSGKNNPSWKGGKVLTSEGYVLIWNRNHPHSNCGGYVRRSRLVMEQHLGRYLKPKEIPHHENEIKDDDRIENLRLFASPGEHTSFHNHLRNLRL